MAVNPIDLTTIAAVKNWLGPNTSTSEDQLFQDIVTGTSLQVHQWTARGNADGSVPTQSPFVRPVSYDEFYDGNGNDELPLRNWPITAVAAVIDTGVTIPQSQGTTSPGWAIDQSNKFLVLRFGGTLYRQRWGYRQPIMDRPGFSLGTQNVEVQYTAGFSAIPFNLELAVRKVCAAIYKRRSWIGQRSQAMAAGAGTVSFDSKQDEKDFWDVIEYYKAVAA